MIVRTHRFGTNRSGRASSYSENVYIVPSKRGRSNDDTGTGWLFTVWDPNNAKHEEVDLFYATTVWAEFEPVMVRWHVPSSEWLTLWITPTG